MIGKNWAAKNKEQTYLTTHAPPATVFLQALQCQIPTACLLTLSCNYMLEVVFVVWKITTITYLATERTSVFGMLRDFNLFDLFPQTGTITCTVFTNNSHFLCAFGLYETTLEGNHQTGRYRTIVKDSDADAKNLLPRNHNKEVSTN